MLKSNDLNSKVQVMLFAYVDCDATGQGMRRIWNVQLHYVLQRPRSFECSHVERTQPQHPEHAMLTVPTIRYILLGFSAYGII